MKLTDKILNKSNSFNHYKNKSEKLEKDNIKLIDKNKKILKENKNLKSDIATFKSKINEIEIKSDKKVRELQKRLGMYSKPEILKKLFNEQYYDLTIAIKSPNPKGHHHWGDYFFSKALKKSFEKKGFNVVIQEREDWYDDNVKADINLVLRGVVEYKPNFDEINIMWNISHPDMVETEEYDNYDICFISSEKYANLLKNNVNTTVKPLLQCTDPDVFFNEEDTSITDDILFVGVTRGVYRDIVKDVLKTNHDVSIYGMGWEKFIDEKFIKGQFIENNELHKYYSSCKILLNDHWEDMRDMDFPSNRLFDALACGAFVISDKISSAETLFEGNIVTYEDADDLKNKIEYYLVYEEKRKMMAKKGKELVLKNHTFDNRVETILEDLNNLNCDDKYDTYH